VYRCSQQLTDVQSWQQWDCWAGQDWTDCSRPLPTYKQTSTENKADNLDNTWSPTAVLHGRSCSSWQCCTNRVTQMTVCKTFSSLSSQFFPRCRLRVSLSFTQVSAAVSVYRWVTCTHLCYSPLYVNWRQHVSGS